MSERLRLGPKPRNKREIGDGPRKGKNQGERLEHSQTRGLSEGHSKRAGSHRVQRESSGRRRRPSRRILGQAQETTCRREQGQSRWAWKHTHSQGRKMEGSQNPRRPAASTRTTRKGSAGNCRVQRGASERGTNPIRKELG